MKSLTHELNGQYWLFIFQYEGREEWHSEAKEIENNKENGQMKQRRQRGLSFDKRRDSANTSDK